MITCYCSPAPPTHHPIMSVVSIRTQHLKLACLFHLPPHNLCQEQYLVCNRYSASYLLNLFSACYVPGGVAVVGGEGGGRCTTERVLFAQEENEAQSADINCPWRKQPGSPPSRQTVETRIHGPQTPGSHEPSAITLRHLVKTAITFPFSSFRSYKVKVCLWCHKP